VRGDTDDLIAFLNSLLAIDPYAIAELLYVRVPCNAALAEHESVQVMGHGSGVTFVAPGSFRVGLLGILNGYCGTVDVGERKGWGPITADYSDGRLIGFRRTESPALTPGDKR
jgi:hypothetical protein